VGARPGERVLDLCAAPGGKATALAAAGATVVAADVRHRRTALLARNARRVAPGDQGLAAAGSATGYPAGPAPGGGGQVVAVTADGTRPPWRDAAFDRVLVDAPCSGLGTLRRRPDLRWRIEADAVGRLAGLQRRLLAAAAGLVRPGGTLVYSVCTLTAAETTGIDGWLAVAHPGLVPAPPPDEPWQAWGRGAMLLPQASGTDGMCLFRYVRRPTDEHG
jgi:16S rRNA (cytosine967-C5)-methyltransferase